MEAVPIRITELLRGVQYPVGYGAGKVGEGKIVYDAQVVVPVPVPIGGM